jgi:hypothetical protein
LRFVLAVSRAAVERACVAVFAALRTFELAVSARRGGAGAGRTAALEAHLDLAFYGATVAWLPIPVVTALGKHQDAVAATRDLMTGFTRRYARKTELDSAAVAQATIAVVSVPVVTRLVFGEVPVSAGARRG